VIKLPVSLVLQSSAFKLWFNRFVKPGTLICSEVEIDWLGYGDVN
jgi:hypothetical protein